jgi:hypothetical protein
MWVATDLLSRTAWYAAHPNRETVRQIVRASMFHVGHWYILLAAAKQGLHTRKSTGRGLLLGWAWVNLRTMGLNFGTLCEGCGVACTTYGNEENFGEPWKF